MKSVDRWQAAEELVAARERFPVPKRLHVKNMEKLLKTMRAAQSELMAELYVTHFTNKQLKALLEFVRSDVGQTIIKTDRVISEEYEKLIPERMKSLTEDWEAEFKSETEGTTDSSIVIKSDREA